MYPPVKRKNDPDGCFRASATHDGEEAAARECRGRSIVAGRQILRGVTDGSMMPSHPPPPSSPPPPHQPPPSSRRTLDPQLASAFVNYRFPDPATTSFGFDLDDDDDDDNDTPSSLGDDSEADTRSVLSETTSIASSTMRRSFLQSRVSRHFMESSNYSPPVAASRPPPAGAAAQPRLDNMADLQAAIQLASTSPPSSSSHYHHRNRMSTSTIQQHRSHSDDQTETGSATDTSSIHRGQHHRQRRRRSSGEAADGLNHLNDSDDIDDDDDQTDDGDTEIDEPALTTPTATARPIPTLPVTAANHSPSFPVPNFTRRRVSVSLDALRPSPPDDEERFSQRRMLMLMQQREEEGQKWRARVPLSVPGAGSEEEEDEEEEEEEDVFRSSKRGMGIDSAHPSVVGHPYAEAADGYFYDDRYYDDTFEDGESFDDYDDEEEEEDDEIDLLERELDGEMDDGPVDELLSRHPWFQTRSPPQQPQPISPQYETLHPNFDYTDDEDDTPPSTIQPSHPVPLAGVNRYNDEQPAFIHRTNVRDQRIRSVADAPQKVPSPLQTLLSPLPKTHLHPPTHPLPPNPTLDDARRLEERGDTATAMWVLARLAVTKRDVVAAYLIALCLLEGRGCRRDERLGVVVLERIVDWISERRRGGTGVELDRSSSSTVVVASSTPSSTTGRMRRKLSKLALHLQLPAALPPGVEEGGSSVVSSPSTPTSPFSRLRVLGRKKRSGETIGVIEEVAAAAGKKKLGVGEERGGMVRTGGSQTPPVSSPIALTSPIPPTEETRPSPRKRGASMSTVADQTGSTPTTPTSLVGRRWRTVKEAVTHHADIHPTDTSSPIRINPTTATTPAHTQSSNPTSNHNFNQTPPDHPHNAPNGTSKPDPPRLGDDE
ncbi:hypothetical protein HDU67_003662 [Dinochytrium kinnereticum]|nr:hypothetical protein HDU67_003662 [Dinochytrium kinnereticum]